MKTVQRFTVVFALLVSFVAAATAQEMTKDQWQQSMRQATLERDIARKDVESLEADIVKLKADQESVLRQADDCHKQLLSLLGSTDAKIKAFSESLDLIDRKLNDLARLSNQELLAQKAELDSVQAMITRAKSEKLSYLPEFAGRLQEEQIRLDSLRQTLKSILASNTGQVYTVGSWAKNRDCLWNIAKKPKIYDNAFLWPKIWQGNRDEIKNPDVIYQGEKLKIPSKAPLTAQEKSALRSYWNQHVEFASSNHSKSVEHK